MNEKGASKFNASEVTKGGGKAKQTAGLGRASRSRSRGTRTHSKSDDV
ncbi:hypothetical protein [Campylobacter curvus]|nr:hypothetical protein [Campylobacter curvus]